MFQHTAARRRLRRPFQICLLKSKVSTHSRPKAAAGGNDSFASGTALFQHTAARRRLHKVDIDIGETAWFQHTAARRRLRMV